MTKKTTPIITHTEILCYAIRHIAAEIEDWQKRSIQTSSTEIAELVAERVAYLNPKLDALKEMYRFETGCEYC